MFHTQGQNGSLLYRAFVKVVGSVSGLSHSLKELLAQESTEEEPDEENTGEFPWDFWVSQDLRQVVKVVLLKVWSRDHLYQNCLECLLKYTFWILIKIRFNRISRRQTKESAFLTSTRVIFMYSKVWEPLGQKILILKKRKLKVKLIDLYI